MVLNKAWVFSLLILLHCSCYGANSNIVAELVVSARPQADGDRQIITWGGHKLRI